jgi:hypothetical protein
MGKTEGNQMNLRRSCLRYANLLNLEHVLGLGVAYLLGSEKWLLFTVCLILTLLLGLGTTTYYWKLMDEANKSSHGSTKAEGT